MPRLGGLDWAVIALYGLVVVGIGAWANRRQRTTEDYFLGGRRMRWWAIGVSLIATSFSSVALIGGTGEGFTRGMGYLQLQVGDLLGILLAVALLLPFFSKLGLTTAYEYLERRFGVVARTLASVLFIGQTLMRTGILVLAPALALSALLGIDLRWAIVVSGVAAVLYSAAGGITAVVWTDLLQFSVVVFGVLASLALVVGDTPGGLGAIWDTAQASGRLEVWNTELDFAKPYTLPWTLIAYGVLALSIAGASQQAVQRYLSCRDLASARRAALLGWGIGLVAVGLTLFLGVALSVWADQATAGAAFSADMTEAVAANQADKALPLFVAHRLPAGLAGLLVAAVFAASMSSMDSAIHSMSTATLVDFVRRFRKAALAPRRELELARLLTVAFGVAATDVALLAAGGETQILQRLITWLGYFAGPLLGLFLLGMATRRATQGGAVAATVLSGLGVIGAVLTGLPKELGFHPLWLAPMALVLTCTLGWLLSLFGKPPTRAQVDALTWHSRG